MKKITFLLGIGALTLASCSNDEVLVAPTAPTAEEAPIGFAVSTGNMSRAATKLSAEYWEFGVWAYKGAKAADATGTTAKVMDDYMVGYWDATSDLGYHPLSNQVLYGSDFTPAADPTPAKGTVWYYEGLGSGEGSKYSFKAGSTGKTVGSSHNASQYLKYWDKASNYTYFYAYAPYNWGGTDKVEFSATGLTMTFPTINATTGKDAMYAVTKVDNSTFKTATSVAANQYVNLEFYRLQSKIRVAFFEEIPGYDVELIPFSSKVSIPATDTWKAFGTNAMYAVPAKKDGGKYVAGAYVTEAQPVVTFAEDGTTGTMSASVSYKGTPTTSSEIINIPLWFRTINTTSTANNLKLGETKATAIVNDTKDVLPASTTTPNDGFTLNVSFKLTATDTGETILVKGASVHVPYTDCQWLPNHLYTYYFKITKAVPGTPDDPVTPTPEPGTDPYLVPIVFDGVTVTTFDDHKVDKPTPGDGYTL